MNFLLKSIIGGGLLIFSIVTGIWLAHKGRPLNTGIFTLHKFISLGFVVLSWVIIHQQISAKGAPAILIPCIVIMAVGVIMLFTTGAIISQKDTAHPVLNLIHKYSSIIMLVTTVVSYLVVLKK